MSGNIHTVSVLCLQNTNFGTLKVIFWFENFTKKIYDHAYAILALCYLLRNYPL